MVVSVVGWWFVLVVIVVDFVDGDGTCGWRCSCSCLLLLAFCEPTRSVWLTMILIGSGVCCCSCLLFVTSFFTN